MGFGRRVSLWFDMRIWERRGVRIADPACLSIPALTTNGRSLKHPDRARISIPGGDPGAGGGSILDPRADPRYLAHIEQGPTLAAERISSDAAVVTGSEDAKRFRKTPRASASYGHSVLGCRQLARIANRSGGRNRGAVGAHWETIWLACSRSGPGGSRDHVGVRG